MGTVVQQAVVLIDDLRLVVLGSLTGARALVDRLCAVLAPAVDRVKALSAGERFEELFDYQARSRSTEP